MEHIAAVHEGKTEFKCAICEDSFAQKKDLKLHIATVHEGAIKFNRITYPQLITEALSSAPDGELAVLDIYKSINLKHPKYKLGDVKWQNIIKKTLSSNKNFVLTKGSQVNTNLTKNSLLLVWKLSQDNSFLTPNVDSKGIHFAQPYVKGRYLRKSDYTKDDGNPEKMKKDTVKSRTVAHLGRLVAHLS